MSLRSVQPQRFRAVVVLPGIEKTTALLGRGAAPASSAAVVVSVDASVVSPPGQSSLPVTPRPACERPPPPA